MHPQLARRQIHEEIAKLNTPKGPVHDNLLRMVDEGHGDMAAVLRGVSENLGSREPRTIYAHYDPETGSFLHFFTNVHGTPGNIRGYPIIGLSVSPNGLIARQVYFKDWISQETTTDPQISNIAKMHIQETVKQYNKLQQLVFGKN